MWNWNMLRLNQLYNPAAVSSVPSTTLNNTGGMIPGLNQPIQPTPQDTNNDDAMQRLAQLYHPSMDMQNQFNSQISQMPLRQNYQLGKVGQIGAALANLGSGGPAGMWGGNPVGYRSNIPGGINVQSALQDAPYNQAMQDWATKLKPLGEAADNERLANVNERNLAEQTITREQGNRRLDLQAKRDEQIKAKEDAKTKLDQENLKVRQQRAEAYQFKQMHPAMKSYIDKDGKLVFVDPTDPTKVVHTEVDTGKMSDMEKMQFQLEGRLEAIRTKGDIDLTRKQTPPAKSPNVSQPKPMSENQQILGIKKRIIQAINANPALKDYFVTDNAGKYTGEVKTRMIGFNDENLHKQAIDIANGSSAGEAISGNEGMIEMKDNNGKTWKVKPENVVAFKKAHGIK